jgi:DNA-binding winged helix-turn-helix (wHTH) protein/tetratricopeptide (TPR) repeat protein
MGVKSHRESFRFGTFEMEISARRLQRDGLKIRLEEKSFLLLSLLVRRAGETVTRDELRKELWPDNVHLDFGHGLNNAVNKLRSALGDPAENPRFVTTIPKVGYRFIAPVQREHLPESFAGREPVTQAGTPGPGDQTLAMRGRYQLLVVLVFLLATAASLIYGIRDRSPVARQVGSAQSRRAAEAYALGVYRQKFAGKQALTGSKEYLEEAVALDPGFAEAHAALALTDEFIGDEISFTPGVDYANAVTEARRALDLDASLANAHVALGNAKLRIDWDWTGAKQEYLRALDLDPRSAEAVDAYARFLVATGQRDAAIRLSERTQALDPSSTRMLYDRAVLSYLSRDYGQAVRQLRSLVVAQPDFPDARKLLSDAYAREGRWNEASAELLRWLTQADSNQDDLRAAHRILREQGLQELWRQHALGTACHRSPSVYGTPFYRAAYFALLGEKQSAMKSLRGAYEQHDTQLLDLKVDPRFDALRSDPEFSQFLGKLGLTL